MRIRFVPVAFVGAALTLPIACARWFLPAVRGWGARSNDLFRPLPGDDLVPDPDMRHTRGITIAAPPDAVWPWLLQLGQGRGGLYSYDWLENLAGCDIHSVDSIVPDLQSLAVGDIVSLRKGDMPAFLVSAIDPGRSLVLVARDPSTGAPAHAAPDVPMAVDESWAFVLEPDGEGATRLLVRGRRRIRGERMDRVAWSLIEAASLPMERRMLLGIRDRAERTVGAARSRDRRPPEARPDGRSRREAGPAADCHASRRRPVSRRRAPRRCAAGPPASSRGIHRRGPTRRQVPSSVPARRSRRLPRGRAPSTRPPPTRDPGRRP